MRGDYSNACMKDLRQKINRISGLAFIYALLVYALFALSVPAGVDLKLCVSADGHVDLFVSGCSTEEKAPSAGCCDDSVHDEEQSSLKGHDDADCLDLDLACGQSPEISSQNQSQPVKVPVSSVRFHFKDFKKIAFQHQFTPDRMAVPEHLILQTGIILLI